jgi:amino acid adenylation domain-containing protein
MSSHETTHASLRSMFAHQVAVRPDATALKQGDRRISYRQLETHARDLAAQIADAGGVPGNRLLVATGRSVDTVAALLAALQTGTTFIAIDATWPASHLARIVDEIQPVHVIADGARADTLAGVASIRTPAAHSTSVAAVDSGDARDRRAWPLTITYTSGSTGRPKGVVTTEASVLERLDWHWRTFAYGPDDVILLHRSPALIGFIRDCLATLLIGACAVVPTDEDARDPGALVGMGERHRVTQMSASPTLWRMIVEWLERHGRQWPTLRVARSGGEALAPELCARWRRVFPSAELWNVYGSTECSAALASKVSDVSASDAVVPVGTGVSGMSAHVLDDEMSETAPGDVGALYLSGGSLALGYLDAPALTAETFVPNPFAHAPGERLLSTGDLCRRRTDGQVEILGRADRRLKIHGFRVEPAEIEAALRRAPGVADVVVAPSGSLGGVRLVAYVSLDDGEAWQPAALRLWAQAALQPHMIPADFVHLDALPKTSSGKVDRAAVATWRAEAAERPVAEAPSQSASTGTEAILSDMWKEVLEIDDVLPDDNFFGLGGNSVLVMQVLARIFNRWSLDLAPLTLFDAPTLRELAQTIDLHIGRAPAAPGVAAPAQIRADA